MAAARHRECEKAEHRAMQRVEGIRQEIVARGLNAQSHITLRVAVAEAIGDMIRRLSA